MVTPDHVFKKFPPNDNYMKKNDSISIKCNKNELLTLIF